jgi:hypothetical protein
MVATIRSKMNYPHSSIFDLNRHALHRSATTRTRVPHLNEKEKHVSDVDRVFRLNSPHRNEQQASSQRAASEQPARTGKHVSDVDRVFRLKLDHYLQTFISACRVPSAQRPPARLYQAREAILPTTARRASTKPEKLYSQRPRGAPRRSP